MKISLLCAGLLTILSIEAAAIAYPESSSLTSDASQDPCFATGAPCNVLKRAAEAAANAMAEPIPGFRDPGHHQCHGAGSICFKAKRDMCGPTCLQTKRDALALAEVVADAAALSESGHQCEGFGSECFKSKRNALAAAEDLAEAEAIAGSGNDNGKPTPTGLAPIYIRNANVSCIDSETNNEVEKIKRAAKAAAEAMAEADPGFRDAGHHQCHGDGVMCFKAKRALDSLNGVVNSML